MYLEKWEFYAFFIQYALGRISNNLINRTNRHLFNEMPPSITSRTFFCGFSKIYFNLGTAETIIHSWGLELGNFKLFWRLSKFSRRILGYTTVSIPRFVFYFFYCSTISKFSRTRYGCSIAFKRFFSPFWNERFTSKWNVLKSYSHFLHWSAENFSTRRDAVFSRLSLSLKRILPFRKRSSTADLAKNSFTSIFKIFILPYPNSTIAQIYM